MSGIRLVGAAAVCVSVVWQVPVVAEQPCVSVDLGCPEFTSCVICDAEPPDAIYTGDQEDGEIKPYFESSPGGDRAAVALATLFPAALDVFDFGSQVDDFEIPQSELDEAAENYADGFDQAALRVRPTRVPTIEAPSLTFHSGRTAA